MFDMAKKNGGPPQPGPATQGRQRPAHEVRIGRLRATLWANQHPEQGTWYSVTLTRSYKDGQGQWKSAQSFGRDDLLALAEVCRQAFLWVHRQYQSPQQNGGAAEEAQGDSSHAEDEEIPF
jgi:hypothetical protein